MAELRSAQTRQMDPKVARQLCVQNISLTSVSYTVLKVWKSIRHRDSEEMNMGFVSFLQSTQINLLLVRNQSARVE